MRAKKIIFLKRRVEASPAPLSLTPGFSPVSALKAAKSRFNGLSSVRSQKEAVETATVSGCGITPG